VTAASSLYSPPRVRKVLRHRLARLLEAPAPLLYRTVACRKEARKLAPDAPLVSVRGKEWRENNGFSEQCTKEACQMEPELQESVPKGTLKHRAQSYNNTSYLLRCLTEIELRSEQS
jgi:hypothetical protein